MVATRLLSQSRSFDRDGRRWQIVSGKGGLNTSSYTDSGGTSINADLRMATRIGPVDACNLRMMFANVVGGTAVDTDNANAISVRAAIEALDGSKLNVAATFFGALSLSLDPKSGPVLTDPIGATLPANKLYCFRGNTQITAGQAMPVSYNIQSGSYLPQDTASSAGENNVRSSSGAQVYNTGALTGSNNGTGFRPLAFIGQVSRPAPAVVILGDSIPAGQGDNTVTNLVVGQGIGYVARGLLLPNNSIIPFANLATPGEAMNGYDTPFLGLDQHRRLAALAYATDVIFHLGTNSLTATTTLVAMQASYVKAWAILKRYGVRVTQATIMPRTTSSDGWTTAAGQNTSGIHANFAPGGLRDQLNAWFYTQIGVLIDDVVNPNSALEDPNAPCCWTSTGGVAVTGDGVHPNTGGHQLAAPTVQAKAIALMQSYGLL